MFSFLRTTKKDEESRDSDTPPGYYIANRDWPRGGENEEPGDRLSHEEMAEALRLDADQWKKAMKSLGETSRANLDRIARERRTA